MTTPTTPVQTSSWRPVLFALAGFVVIPMFPTALQATVPITQTIVLIVAALAVCAVVGWWKGGSAIFAGIWLVLLAWMFTATFEGVAGYSVLAHGWTLLLAALFGLTSLITPNQSFVVRALTSVGTAVVISFALTVVAPNGLDTVEGIMHGEYTRRVEHLTAGVREATRTPEWRSLTKRYPMLDSAIAENEATLRTIPNRTAALFPALLALESLAALALGWALYHRLASIPIGPALGRLRDFRFNDQLVWGLAVGATIVFLPPFADARNTGWNVLVFFGMLYLLRGVGVLSWVSRGRGVATILIVLTAIAPPLIAALALGVGVGDTWMDWRSRVQPTT